MAEFRRIIRRQVEIKLRKRNVPDIKKLIHEEQVTQQKIDAIVLGLEAPEDEPEKKKEPQTMWQQFSSFFGGEKTEDPQMPLPIACLRRCFCTLQKGLLQEHSQSSNPSVRKLANSLRILKMAYDMEMAELQGMHRLVQVDSSDTESEDVEE